MLKALWNGRSGLNANQNRLDAISNNISNLETNGYKKIDVAFEDIFGEKMDRLGLPVTSDNRGELVIGSGSRGDRTVKNNLQGTLFETGKDTDLAISGAGFFKVIDDKGEAFYTRDGSFNTDSEGNLVHSSGMKLEIKNFNKGSLGNTLSIKANGEIMSENGLVGKVVLYDFQDKDNMISAGGNLLKGTGSPQKASGEIKQGYIEGSNVDLAKELTDMMMTQRAFELNSRSVKAADDMWQIANNLKGR